MPVFQSLMTPIALAMPRTAVRVGAVRLTVGSIAMVGVMISLATLTGCQSVPHMVQPSAPLSAHDLMQQTLLHRFDQSYDFEKTTRYQVASLYAEDDIERNDASLYSTVTQIFTGGLSPEPERDISPEQLACETSYSEAYTRALTQYDSQETATAQSKQDSNAMIDKAQTAYQACLAALPAHQRISISKTPDAVQTTDEQSQYASIRGIASTNSEDYQKTIKSLNKRLKKLDEKNQQKTLPANDTDALERLLNGISIPKPENDTDIAGIDEPPQRTLSQKLRDLKFTPEQIQVINDSYLTPQSIRYQGSYHQPSGQFSTVLEEHYQTDYKQIYKRIPVLVNLNDMSITMEPDVALPMASILFKKTLPATLSGKSVKFTLPEPLRQNIPLPMLKDSLIKAIAQAYGDMDAEKFDELVVDTYGQSIHASRVIKVNLSVHDMGFLVGRTLKHWSKELASIRAAHPEYIQDNSSFALTLDLLASANKLYRADDMAKAAQIIEAILPVSYNSFNYYYFNERNQLIGYRKVGDYTSSMFNAKAKSITTNIIHYRNDNQIKHPFYQPSADDIIDGNALIKKLMREDKLKTEAEDARFGYSLDNLTLTEDSADPLADCAEQDTACQAAKAAQAVAEAASLEEQVAAQIEEPISDDTETDDTDDFSPVKKVEIATIGGKVE